MSRNHSRTAIVGAGPGGLVAARYLREYGFDCTIYEQSHDIGGQWNAPGEHSGTWPAMRTNTSRVLTRFSDLRHKPGIATYPSNQEVLAYLKQFAMQFGLIPCLRIASRVESVERLAGGFAIRSSTNGVRSAETFDYVVVASGRYNHPVIPRVAGLENFTGAGGVIHSFVTRTRRNIAGCASWWRVPLLAPWRLPAIWPCSAPAVW